MEILADLEKEFLDYEKLQLGHKKNTLYSDKSTLKLLSKWLKDRPFTLEACEQFLLYKKSLGAKNNYLRRIVVTLRNIAKFLKKPWGDKIPCPKIEKSVIEIIDIVNINRIINCPSKHPFYSLFYKFLAKTGCRLSEGINLKVGDLSNGFAHITKSKTGKERYIPLNNGFEQEIKNNCKNKSLNDLVFTTPKSHPFHPTRVREELNYRTKELNLPHIYPHMFRHSFITEMLRANPPGGVAVVSKIVGHVNPVQTLNTYQHLLKEDTTEAIKYSPFEKGQKDNQTDHELISQLSNQVKDLTLAVNKLITKNET